MRLTNMIRVLEDCIAFINQMSVTMSTTGANSMLLEDYVLNTLLLKPDKWDEVCIFNLSLFFWGSLLTLK
jgi:hypothetical protein